MITTKRFNKKDFMELIDREFEDDRFKNVAIITTVEEDGVTTQSITLTKVIDQ